MAQTSVLPLFSGTPAEYEKMVACFHAPTKTYQPGETICNFDAQQRNIGILRTGKAMMVRIDISGGYTVLERLQENDIFGEVIAFSPLVDDSICMIAQSSCSVLFLPYHQLIHPCDKNCDCHQMLLENLFALISKKTLELSRRVEILSCRSIREKLLCFFRITSAQEKCLCFPLPFSLSTLAAYICADRSAMMRELKKMREEKLVEISDKTVCLHREIFEPTAKGR